MGCIPLAGTPNCRQTTVASLVLQKSSQTVPQTLLLHNSTRPSYSVEPPSSRRSPVVQDCPAIMINEYNVLSFVCVEMRKL